MVLPIPNQNTLKKNNLIELGNQIPVPQSRIKFCQFQARENHACRDDKSAKATCPSDPILLYIRMLSRFQNKGTFRHVLQVDNKHIKMVSFVPSNFLQMQSHGVNKRRFC
jgi:hypothetical protein